MKPREAISGRLFPLYHVFFSANSGGKVSCSQGFLCGCISFSGLVLEFGREATVSTTRQTQTPSLPKCSGRFQSKDFVSSFLRTCHFAGLVLLPTQHSTHCQRLFSWTMHPNPRSRDRARRPLKQASKQASEQTRKQATLFGLSHSPSKMLAAFLKHWFGCLAPHAPDPSIHAIASSWAL